MGDTKKSSIAGKTTCHLVNIRHPDKVAKRMKLGFARTRASVTVLKADRSVEASVSFLDLTEAGASLFTSELLLKGSTVELCITEPHLLRVRAVVAWSVPKGSGLHLQRFGFRSGLQFVCENEVQRLAISEFTRKVNTDPIEAMRMGASAPPASGGAIELAPTEGAVPVAESAPGEVAATDPSAEVVPGAATADPALTAAEAAAEASAEGAAEPAAEAAEDLSQAA